METSNTEQNVGGASSRLRRFAKPVEWDTDSTLI